MITENQVINYLKYKDENYLNKFTELLYEQNYEDIDPSHNKCSIFDCIHFKKNRKNKNLHELYLCLDCHISFSDITNIALFYEFHLVLDKFVVFLKLEVYKISLCDEVNILMR